MPAVAHIIRRRQNRKRRRQHESRRSAFWFALVVALPLALALAPLFAALALALWLYISAASHMPTPHATVFRAGESGETRFYDASGAELIHAVADPLGEDRRWLRLEDLPPTLVSAAQMAEMAGQPPAPTAFNPAHALSQVWRYILGLPPLPEGGLGGSLARDAILPLVPSSGLDASLLEIALAAESRRRHSPEALLEWRLNSGYFGHDAFGIEAASQVYLGKSASGLSLAEAALLAPIVAEPALNPIDEPLKARERGADLLFQLLEARQIDQAQFDEASAQVVYFRAPGGNGAEIAPAFIEYARRQAEDILDRQGLDGAQLLARGGLRVITSLDLRLQRAADCALRARLGAEEAVGSLDGSPCLQALALMDAEQTLAPKTGSLALIDVSSGALLSLAGDALSARHQPAVTLQPVVYLEAFLRREITPASMIYDLPQTYPGRSAELIYAPVNPDGVYRGPLNLRDAMAANLLPPAVQVASMTGMEAVIRLAQALGFNSLEAGRHDLDLLERGGAVTALDAAYATSVLAANGAMRGLSVAPIAEGFRSRDPVAILRIEAEDGRLLWDYDGSAPANESAIIEPSAAYLVNDALADAQARERALGAEADPPLSRPAALVNGSSADNRDRWTLLYTPDLALAAHTGFPPGAPVDADGRALARSASIWRALMEYAHEHLQLPPRAWDAPADIEEFLVCEISGLLPATTDHCPTRRELAPSGSQLQRDHYWQTVTINRANGQLATVNTPEALRESVAFFIPPEDVMDWWQEAGKPLPPSSYSTESGGERVKPVRLVSPADYAYVGATVEIAAVVNRAEAQSWRLEYGADANPDRWFRIGESQSLDESREITTAWDTALFSGIYTMRLSVTFADGSVESDSRLLTFDNTPPAVKLRTSDGAELPGFQSGELVSLLADVSDNLAIARVEFYRDGELLGEDRDWPYQFDLELDEVGENAFRAIAYDQVGNKASSELVLSVEA